MKIINQTKNTVVAENVFIARTPFQRMKGLLGSKVLRQGEAMILRPCNSVHTFFMRFAIDVIFVDKNNQIVKIIASLKPFRISGIYWRASLAVELPAGSIQSSLTHLGDTLSFQ